MNDLVRRLCEKDHPVEVVIRPEKTVKALRDCVDRKYIHIKFTDTSGGTELGITLDPEASRLEGADFENQLGSIRFVGSLTLDYVKVRCIADVDLGTFAGKGRLEVVEKDAGNQ